MRHIPIERSAVLGPAGREYACAGLGSFELGETETVDHYPGFTPALSLHHFDLPARRLCWVETQPPVSAFDPPFIYQQQRDRARAIYRAPLITARPFVTPLARKPLLFFSIGRCGSTLLSRIANGCGIISWAEPDTFTTLAHAHGFRQREPKLFHMLVRSSLADIDRLSFGYPAFGLKFRAEVTSIMENIARAAAGAKIYFLIRKAVAWARSYRRVFGRGGVESAQVLAWLIACVRQARASGLDIEIVDYDTMIREPEPLAANMAQAAGLPPPAPESLRRILDEDAQAGMSIHRQQSGFGIKEDFDAEFLQTLAEHAPGLDPHDTSGWFTGSGASARTPSIRSTQTACG